MFTIIWQYGWNTVHLYIYFLLLTLSTLSPQRVDFLKNIFKIPNLINTCIWMYIYIFISLIITYEYSFDVCILNKYSTHKLNYGIIRSRLTLGLATSIALWPSFELHMIIYWSSAWPCVHIKNHMYVLNIKNKLRKSYCHCLPWPNHRHDGKRSLSRKK
jgi:hypothetical protein